MNLKWLPQCCCLNVATIRQHKPIIFCSLYLKGKQVRDYIAVRGGHSSGAWSYTQGRGAGTWPLLSMSCSREGLWRPQCPHPTWIWSELFGTWMMTSCVRCWRLSKPNHPKRGGHTPGVVTLGILEGPFEEQWKHTWQWGRQWWSQMGERREEWWAPMVTGTPPQQLLTLISSWVHS